MIASQYRTSTTFKSIHSGAFVVFLLLLSNTIWALGEIHTDTDSLRNKPEVTVDSIPLSTKDNPDTLTGRKKAKEKPVAPAQDSLEIVYIDHSPRLAVIYSMVLPGLGQAYNRKYWKIPLIYGGGAVIYYFFETNNDYYQRFKNAYNDKVDGLPISDEELIGMTKETLALNRDYYRRNRDYNIIFLGLLYTANIIDAMVDAHLLYYDISDDLSLKVTPQVMPQYDFARSQFTASAGVGLRLTFK